MGERTRRKVIKRKEKGKLTRRGERKGDKAGFGREEKRRGKGSRERNIKIWDRG